MWADSLPGAVALVAAAGANRSLDLLPVPPGSPHLAPTAGSFAPELRTFYDRRSSAGIGEGSCVIFRLHSVSMSQAAELALSALGTSKAKGDALLLSRIGRRIELGRSGDLVASIFGDAARGDSESAQHISGHSTT